MGVVVERNGASSVNASALTLDAELTVYIREKINKLSDEKLKEDLMRALTPICSRWLAENLSNPKLT
jgi:hypothetical protein